MDFAGQPFVLAEAEQPVERNLVFGSDVEQRFGARQAGRGSGQQLRQSGAVDADRGRESRLVLARNAAAAAAAARGKQVERSRLSMAAPIEKRFPLPGANRHAGTKSELFTIYNICGLMMRNINTFCALSRCDDHSSPDTILSGITGFRDWGQSVDGMPRHKRRLAAPKRIEWPTVLPDRRLLYAPGLGVAALALAGPIRSSRLIVLGFLWRCNPRSCTRSLHGHPTRERLVERSFGVAADRARLAVSGASGRCICSITPTSA